MAAVGLEDEPSEAAIVELGLRIGWGRPAGHLVHTLTPANGMYWPGVRVRATWGPIPYSIDPNALGFRGREISRRKPEGVWRIAAVGDSITDGFFVDDPDTYPWVLQDLLRERGHRVEVVNAAHGGASIDKELAIVRHAVIPIEADAVILTFVGNDLVALRGKSLEELLDYPLDRGGVRILDWIRARTALGELVSDAWLLATSPPYRRERARTVAKLALLDGDRYAIEGAEDVARNLELFHTVPGRCGLFGGEEFDAEVTELLEKYLAVLAELARLCDAHEMRLILSYFPCYAQVFDERFSPRLSRALAERSGELGIPYLDLTAAFRREARLRRLHLAPLDWHLTPAGYRLIATEVADFLERRGLLPPKRP